MNTKSKTVWVVNFVFYVFLALVIYVILKYLIVYLLPFLIGFSAVYVLQRPSIKLSDKLKISKNAICCTLLIMFFLLISAIIAFAVWKIAEFVISILNDSSDLSAFFENIEKLNVYFEKVFSNLPNNIKGSFSITEIFTKLYEYLYRIFINTAKYIASSFPGFAFSTIISVVSSFFFVFYYDSFIVFIKRQITVNSVSFIKKLKKVVNYSIFSLFKGYLILMLITFIEILSGLLLLGVKNAVAISLLISLVDLLPVFGTGSVLVPWALVEIVSKNYYLGIGLILLFAIYTVARYFIEPKVIGAKVGINPLVSLAAMYLGLKLFGFLGLLIFPVIASILSVLQKNGLIKLFK